MVTRTDWWLDDIPEKAKAVASLAPTLQADQAIFVEYADEAKTKARVKYPTDSENLVAAPVAPGVYSEGAICPVVLASDGRISGVLLPIAPGEGEPQPTGELGQDQLAARNAAGLISDMDQHLTEMNGTLTQVKTDMATIETQMGPIQAQVDQIPAIRQTAQQAQESAVSAGNVANMARQIALGLVYTGPDTPAPDPAAYQLWFVTKSDDDGTLKGVSSSDGQQWATRTDLTGMLIVPGPDGPTVIGPDGVNTSKLLADVIASQFAAFGMVSAEMLQIVPRFKLDGAAQDSLDAADELDKRITLADGTVTISQRPKNESGSDLTALILQPTKLDFVVNGQVVGYMDSERQQLYIQNINMPGQMMFGEHLAKVDEQHRLNFNWVGRIG